MGRKGKSGMPRTGNSRNAILNTNTKFTTKELNSMSRSDLELVARAVYVKQNVSRGLSVEEANRRAISLMSGNTDAQLKKFIKKNG